MLTTKQNEKTYLKDKYARKLLNSEEYQETDVLFENDMMYCNIEINYNFSKDLEIKNQLYIGNLIVRQIYRGESYFDFKKIIQINFNEKMNGNRFGLDLLGQGTYNEIKKLNKLDLKWLLYLFVCEDSEERENMYQDNPMMRGVMKKLEKKELEEMLNELLYYDHEKFERDAMYAEIRRKEKIEIVEKMIEDNLKPETIGKYTGLSIDHIKILQDPDKKKNCSIFFR